MLAVSPMQALTVHATRGYEATVNQSAITLDMRPGEQRTVILTYKNTGTSTWYRSSAASYVSLYLVGKTSSPLGGPAWRTNDSPARITDTSVKPGGSTTVKFTVYAHTAGTFTETVRLAAEDTAWMYGSETKLTVNVKGSAVTAPTTTAPAPTPTTSPTVTTTPTAGQSAVLLLRSAKELSLTGDQRVQVTFGFKNTGSTMWTSRSLKLSSLFPAMTDVNTSMADATWKGPGEPAREDTVTNPGEIGFLSFWLKAPARSGTYRASFALEANGKAVEGGFVDLPVTVTADGVIQTQPPILPPTTAPVVVSGDGIQNAPLYIGTEPVIRVGIFATTDDQMIIRGAGPFRVQQKGNTICSFNANEEVVVRFDRTNKVYKATGPRCQSQSTELYQVQRTDDVNAHLEMTDFYRPVGWLPGANDNTFRTVLELRWSSETDAVWVINELPLELYLRGIAETSDVSPMEYQKALLIGARTYAYHHWRRATKHADEGFHVDAKYDQVYRGYGAEARSPKIVQAVTETRGQAVTYNGALAITPYFSRSDGRTRNWTEVWGGSGFPWLVSVPVPEDIGRTLWGHGVGLSATGALTMAKNGSLYQDILKHFYQGTQVMRFY